MCGYVISLAVQGPVSGRPFSPGPPHPHLVSRPSPDTHVSCRLGLEPFPTWGEPDDTAREGEDCRYTPLRPLGRGVRDLRDRSCGPEVGGVGTLPTWSSPVYLGPERGCRTTSSKVLGVTSTEGGLHRNPTKLTRRKPRTFS